MVLRVESQEAAPAGKAQIGGFLGPARLSDLSKATWLVNRDET